MSEQMPPQGITQEQALALATEEERPILEILLRGGAIATNRFRLQAARDIAKLTRSSPTPAAIEEDEASAIYDKLAEREPQIKGDIVSRIVDAVYRSVEITEAGTWWLNNLRAKARVKHIITKHLNARGEGEDLDMMRFILERATAEPCRRSDYGWAGTCENDAGPDNHYACVPCLARKLKAARAAGEEKGRNGIE